MPNKNTFKIKPIEELIEETVDLSLLWIDTFANQNRIASVTNDLNTQYDRDYHLDALDFLKMFDDNSVDGVLYDRPYSPRQVVNIITMLAILLHGILQKPPSGETTREKYPE